MFWRKEKDEPIWDKDTGLLMHYPNKVVDEPTLHLTPNKKATGELLNGDNSRGVETVTAFLRRMSKPGNRFRITLEDGLGYVASAYNERSGRFFLKGGDESFYISRRRYYPETRA